jgi:hypothetical protein
MEQIPTVLSLVTISRWAPLYDRVGVLRFRVTNSAFWLASFVLVTLGVLIHRPESYAATMAGLSLFVVGRVINGVARAGGAIAWNLGHLHFAGEHDAELYMGIHVALTGFRGLLMSFVGTVAYKFCGGWALLLGIALALAAQWAFRRLALSDGALPAQPLTPAPQAAVAITQGHLPDPSP